MADQRKLLETGSTLILGGVCYRVEAFEGKGGSAVVYRASYPDALNVDTRHIVLIKELFPLNEHGWIYRAEDGRIICMDEGKDLMEISRSRFFMGNQINLELLQHQPSGISGNINSYEAYGTFYSVLSVHGGTNLKQILVDEKKEYSLKESVAVMKKILLALDAFHRNGLLHLDISPDNILLLPSQALLIDYNSVWDVQDVNAKEFVFSEKQGYSAPEIRLRNAGDVNYSTDIYSVCAVFFHLLWRRPLRDEEAGGQGLKRTLSGNAKVFQEVPGTAVQKAVQILMKGLHPLNRRRYQNIAGLEEDLEELQNRIDKKGVSHSALWESSLAVFKRNKEASTEYLVQPVRVKRAGRDEGRYEKEGKDSSKQEERQTGEELSECLAKGGCFLLTGPGGMGKTRFLEELWKKGTAFYSAKEAVLLYISLKDYQETGGAALFIRSVLLKGLQFTEEMAGYQEALHELELLFEERTAADKVSIILLLDGLNEAGEKQEKLLLEIEELGGRSGVGILITDRIGEVLSYALSGFAAAKLCPLTTEQIDGELKKNGLPVLQERQEEKTKTERFYSLLSQPMMLFLYLDAVKNGGNVDIITAPDMEKELILLYLEGFCRRALRTAAGSREKQLCIRYILEHLLPAAAFRMQKKKKTLLTFDEICQVSDKSFSQLTDGSFGKAFPDYHGKSRIMLEKIAGKSEWFDFAVNENLIENFGLLVRTEGGYYGLLHDHFQAVLAEKAEENQGLLRRKEKKVWKIKAAVVLAASVLAGAAGYGVFAYVLPFSGHLQEKETKAPSFTPEEEEKIHEAVACLSTSLGKWSSQIAAQKEIVAEAKISDVLDNQDEGARKNLEAVIRQKEDYLSSLYASPLSETLAADLLKLQEEKGGCPAEVMEELCGRYAVMESVSTALMEELREKLCAPDSVYDSRDKRERIVLAYQSYLDAEVKYVSYQLAILLSAMTPEQEEEVRGVITYMEALDDFYDGPGSVEKERLNDGQKRAYEALKKAQQEMNSAGYRIDWEQKKEEKQNEKNSD